jgi:clathrin heavy chain
MARSLLKEQMIDSELVFAYAKCGQRYLPELEQFISEPNQADIQKCGDRCFDEKLNEAAKILYTQVGNNQKLAQVLVKLKQYSAAFEAAKKADIPRVWKEVCFACVRAKEFRTANMCAMKIIILPDHLEDLIKHYEKFGFQEELINLLE